MPTVYLRRSVYNELIKRDEEVGDFVNEAVRKQLEGDA